jgi:hypothetical protein
MPQAEPCLLDLWSRAFAGDFVGNLCLGCGQGRSLVNNVHGVGHCSGLNHLLLQTAYVSSTSPLLSLTQQSASRCFTWPAPAAWHQPRRLLLPADCAVAHSDAVLKSAACALLRC